MVDEEVAAGAFAHGFLASNAAARIGGRDGWTRTRTGSFQVLVHPATEFAEAAGEERGGPAVLVLGQVVDLDRPTTNAHQVARRLRRHLRAGGLEAASRYAADLGGRWAAFVTVGGETHVLHDSHAAQSVYWTRREGTTIIASHAALCAAEADSDVDEDLLGAFGRIREVRPKGTVFLPGARTPFLGVRPVIANCRLEIDVHGAAEHRRYRPATARLARPAQSEEAYAEFHHRFERHMELLCSRGPIGLSLTAGGDSAVTLRGLLRSGARDAFAYTYVNPRDLTAKSGQTKDLFGANARAHQAGLPHRVIRWRTPPAGSAFAEIVAQMWPHSPPSVGAAYAMYCDLPRGFYELQSTVSESGTVFYTNRTDERPSAQRLTTLWASSAAAERPEFVEAFEEYIDYAQFTPDRLQGYDYHDLFYWEHRNTRWAAEKYQVGDIGHRVLLPFNARPILETMLSLPYRDRLDKWLLTEYLRRSAPPTGGPLRRSVRAVRRVASRTVRR